MRLGIALGSNLGDRLAQLAAARERIAAIPGVSGPMISSRIYETEPVQSEPGAGAFLNAVLEVEYDGDATTLAKHLQAIEAQLGRPPERPRNASRVIDLDVLYVGDLVLDREELTIPHPRLHLRRFVLAPLAELRPDLTLPLHTRSVRELLAELPETPAVAVAGHQWTV